MAGKSLDEIWRQIQAQRQAEIQRQQAQERLLNEQRERARQEYLRNMRMYEKVGPTIPTSSAPGSGGGSIRRQNVVTTTSDESILYFNFEDGKFSYFIYNFETDVLTDIKEISLQNYPSIFPVTRGGFFLQSFNNDNSNYDLLFISLNGEIIWQDSTSNNSDVDIENFSRYVAAYYLKDGIWKLVVFNENGEIRQFDFENPIEGGGYSYDDVWNGGFVVREDIDNIQKFYIINFEAGTSTLFNEVNTDTDYLNVYLYAYSNKILSVKNGNLFEVFSSNGQKISEFNVLEEFDVESYYYDDFVFLNANGSFVLIGFIEDTRNIIFFSGESNQFSYKRVDTGDYQYYRYDVYDQKNYILTNDWIAEGSAIFMFYNNDNEINGIDYYSSCIILPVWSTDSELRDFYELTSEKGIVTDLDDSDIAITRNADYINLLIDNDELDENYSILRFNREGDSNTIIPTTIPKNELDDDDQINGKTILQFERNFEVNGTWGWDDLSDLEDRFFYSFRKANDWDIKNNVIGQEFVMKDTVNDEYWAIEFTDWQQGGGGGFAYNRKVISGGTFGYVGKYWYHNIAREVDENGVRTEGTGNWKPYPSTTYQYTIEWYNGHPNTGELVSTETFNVSIINEPITPVGPGLNPASSSRIQEGGTKVRDIIFDKDNGVATLTYQFELDENGYITGQAKADLEAQVPGSGGTPGVGYYAIGVGRPQANVTHAKWSGILSYAPTFDYNGINPIIKFSGNIISFTHSNWETSEPDVIVPGVLEIKRGEYGPIYNSAVEDESNGNNPIGTLWNSQFVYNLEPSYNYKWWSIEEGLNPTSSVDFNALFIGTPNDSGVTYNSNIDWTSVSGKPSYLPSTDFAWQVECLLKVEVAGDYLFMTNSDDGNQLTINGEIVTEFYGGRGMASGGETSSTIPLSVGLHTFRYRMQQGGGGSGASVKWKIPGEENFFSIPSDNLVINENISEYDHYIVNTEGQVVDKVTTSDDYDNDYEGSTFILVDEIFGKTWVSNNQNGKQFQLLPKYYNSTEDSNTISDESGLRLGNFIISNRFRNRIVTEDSISGEFVTPKLGQSEVEEREIFYNGAWVLTEDESNRIFYFYNISGQLISQKSIIGDYNTDDRGKRCSIRYTSDDKTNVILFNGIVLKEVNTDFENINIVVNDYYTWD